MKNNKAFRKILSLLMCVLFIAGIVPFSGLKAIAAESTDVWFLRGTGYSTTQYHITYANGGTTSLKGILTLEIIDGHLAYCIDPGTQGGGTASDYALDDSEDSFSVFNEKMAAKYSTNGAGLTVRQIYDMLKIAVAYGFSSNENPKSWGEAVIGEDHQPTGTYFIRNNAHREKIFRAIATQIIIQEIASGERKADFSHYGGSIHLVDEQLGTSSAPRTEFANEIRGYYNQYVAAIGNAINNKNKTPTVSTQTHTATSAENTKFDLGTIELKPDSNGMVSGEKTFAELDYLPEGYDVGTETARLLSTTLPGAGASLAADGKTVKVSIPLQTAIDYQNQAFPAQITKSVKKTTDDGEVVSYEYMYAPKINIYTRRAGSGADIQVKTCISATPEVRTNTVQNKTEHTYNYEYNFNIKIPVIHTHKWLPHVTAPTCTTEGLTCYFCTCGMIYTYSNGVSDSITGNALPNGGVTPPLGHDHQNGKWVVSVPATCTADGEEKQLCSRCGMVIDSRKITASGHDTAPEDGGRGVWVITKQPDEKTEGTQSLYCTKCGKVIKTKPIENHEHTAGPIVTVINPTCTQKGLKGRFCTECNVCISTASIPAGHSGNIVWYTKTAAACTEEGERIGLCADCGAILASKKTEALGHAESVDMISVVPTCTAPGEQLSYCTRCGEITDSKPVDALGHDEGVWTVSADPTCELPGEQINTCTRCGEITDSKPVDALGHDEQGVWKIDIPATADHEGSMSEYCTRCGMVLNTKAFRMHEHTYGYQTVLLKATCSRDGEKGTVCGICSAIYETEVIKAEGHEYQEQPFISSEATHSQVCAKCRHKLTQNHNFIQTENVVVTCSSSGYNTYVCEDCGYSYSTDFAEPTGHSFGRFTADADGKTHTRYCMNPGCGVFEQHLHTWSGYEITKDATIKNGVIRTRVCTLCGETQSYEGEDTISVILEKAYVKTLDFLEFLINFLNLVQSIIQLLRDVVGSIKMFP